MMIGSKPMSKCSRTAAVMRKMKARREHELETRGSETLSTLQSRASFLYT